MKNQFKIKLLTLLSLFLISHIGVAQKTNTKGTGEKEVNLSMGKAFKSRSREQNKFYLGKSNDSYFFLREKGGLMTSNYSIDKVNSGMNLVRNKEIKFKKDGWRVVPAGSFQLGERVMLLTIDKKQGEKYSDFVAQELNPEKLSLSNPVILGSVNASVGSGGFETQLFGYSSLESYFKIKVRPDSTGFLVLYNLKGKKSDNEKFGFNVFDANMEKKWDMEVELPYSEKLFEILDVRIDNGDAIYVVGKLYDEYRAEKRKNKVNYTTKIFKFVKGSSEPASIFDIEFDDVYLSSLRLIFRADKISAVGFFKKMKSTGEDGVFVLNLDPETGKLIDYNMEAFSRDFFLMDLKESQQKKTSKKLDKGKGGNFFRMQLDYVIPQKDGGMIVLAEQRYLVIQTTQTANGQTSTTYHYYGNDIIAFKVDNDDKISWYTKIPKRQHTQDNAGVGTSYVAIPTAERILFIYNEGNKAFDPKVVAQKGKYSNFRNYGKGIVSLTILDLEGNTTKVKLLDKTNGKFIVTPKTRAMLSDGAILQFFTTKEKRYAKISVNDLIEIGF
jgi:hypothetical protein